jgi:JmjC domain, hydroxylase
MPAMVNDRDRRVQEEAHYFCKTKSFYPRPCRHFTPTLEELQSTTFSEYVRNTVLRQSQRGYHSDDEEEDDDENQPRPADSSSRSSATAAATAAATSKRTSRGGLDGATATGSSTGACQRGRSHASKPMVQFDYGIARVTLPEGFSELAGIGKDRTGRGAEWQAGTRLGDMVLPSPMKQIVRGIGGTYEYTFLDQDPITVAEFRTKADEYLESQVGRMHNDQTVEELERRFWKRLGPTMQPPMYGADMEGTLFSKDDDCHGFNVSKLQSCLQLLLMDREEDSKDGGGIPGVTTPYLYFGMWASVFCAHTEDMNLLSINYLHAGAPKVWYAVAAGDDAHRFEQLLESNYHQAKKTCPEYLRHKRSLVSPAILKKAGIPCTRTVQYPGDLVITFPASYHCGFNTGFNVAEATNFAVPEWIPYGRLAKVCLCRPDSVRFDMNRFERLLLQYEKEVLQTKRVSWKDWVARAKKKRHQEEILTAAYGSSPKKVARTTASTNTDEDHSKGKPAKRKDFWVEVVHPALKQAAKSKGNKGSSKKRNVVVQEIWHLARPLGRKILRPSDRVLCIIPATMDEMSTSTTNERASSKDDEEEDDEQCFAGSIIEMQGDHVRVRLDGFGRNEDVWLEFSSPKLFLDGGRWEESPDHKLPALHYWKEEDSRDACV